MRNYISYLTVLTMMLALALAACSKNEAEKPEDAKTETSGAEKKQADPKGKPAEPAAVEKEKAGAAPSEAAASEDHEVLVVVKKNLEAAKKEDIEAYMSTLDEQSPAYAGTRELMEQAFKAYDLQYQNLELSVGEIEDGTARVKFIQVTRKVSGPEFRDNKVTGYHTLKKTESGWKITDTEIVDVEFFEGE